MRRIAFVPVLAMLLVLAFSLSVAAQTATPGATPVPVAADNNSVLYGTECASGFFEECTVVSGLQMDYLGGWQACHRYDYSPGAAVNYSAWTCYVGAAGMVRDPNLFEDGAVQLDFNQVTSAAHLDRIEQFAFLPPIGAVAWGISCAANGVGSGGTDVGFRGTFTGSRLYGVFNGALAGWTETAINNNPPSGVEFGLPDDQLSGAASRSWTWAGAGLYVGDGVSSGYVWETPPGMVYMQSSSTNSTYTMQTVGACRAWWRYHDSVLPTPDAAATASASANATATAGAIISATLVAGGTATVLASTPTVPWVDCMLNGGAVACTPTPVVPVATVTVAATATPIPNFAATILAGWPTSVNTPNFATMQFLLSGIATSVAKGTHTPTVTPTGTATFVPGALSIGDLSPSVVAGATCFVMMPGWSIGINGDARWFKMVTFGLVGWSGWFGVTLPRYEICGRDQVLPSFTVFGYDLMAWVYSMITMMAILTVVRFVMQR